MTCLFKKAERSEKMKPSLSKTIMASLLTLGLITNILYYSKVEEKEKLVYMDRLYDPAIYQGELVSDELVDTVDEVEKIEEQEEETVQQPERIIVYDNMTMEELTEKLNNILSSDLAGTGDIYAKYSIELGVDPYLAVAISMHETGCMWGCSYLARQCNNIGGQKGTGCGEYQAYSSLEEGIHGFILNIKNMYVDFGLLTAEEMNPKYAEDPMWASKVNKYIEKIKNS